MFDQEAQISTDNSEKKTKKKHSNMIRSVEIVFFLRHEHLDVIFIASARVTHGWWSTSHFFTASFTTDPIFRPNSQFCELWILSEDWVSRDTDSIEIRKWLTVCESRSALVSVHCAIEPCLPGFVLNMPCLINGASANTSQFTRKCHPV